jgi:hypothetical protein
LGARPYPGLLQLKPIAGSFLDVEHLDAVAHSWLGYEIAWRSLDVLLVNLALDGLE